MRRTLLIGLILTILLQFVGQYLLDHNLVSPLSLSYTLVKNFYWINTFVVGLYIGRNMEKGWMYGGIVAFIGSGIFYYINLISSGFDLNESLAILTLLSIFLFITVSVAGGVAGGFAGKYLGAKT